MPQKRLLFRKTTAGRKNRFRWNTWRLYACVFKNVGILGRKVVKPENPCYIKLENSWIILNSGGGPTPDKPEVIEVQRDVVRSNSGAQQRCCLIVRRPKVWELV